MNRDLTQAPLRILLASSEAQSLAGSGELAEFTTTLATALHTVGQDVRLLLPAYPAIMEQHHTLNTVARLRLPGCEAPATLLQTTLDNGITLYLLRIPDLFERDGTPYLSPEGIPWHDNGKRFGLFSRAISLLAVNQAGLNWQPDVLHCAGWGSALSIPLVAGEWNRPATVYSLPQHGYTTLDSSQVTPLALSVELLKSGVLATDDGFSFEKGAAITADRVLLPSHGYQNELLQAQFQHPLSALLNERREQVSGFPLGIDYQRWSPATDAFIEQHFDSASFELKQHNRKQLQDELALPIGDGHLLLGYIPDSISQQELALLAELMTAMDRFPTIHIIATGGEEAETLQALRKLAGAHPESLTLKESGIESLKHRILASSDCLLLPAPAYPSARPAQAALSYGTIPIVHGTAAMHETLTDATPANLLNGIASGFIFDEYRTDHLIEALERVTRFRAKPAIWWGKLAQYAMGQSFPASHGVSEIITLYRNAIDHPAVSPVAGSI